MAFCGKCGASVPENSDFCGKCGAKMTQAKKRPSCTRCGAEIEDGLIFCSKCGAKISEVAKPSDKKYIPTPIVIEQPSVENELYRKKMIGYYAGVRQISGEFLVTNKKIVYTPMAMYVLDKPFTIDMSEVLSAARASVMGMNLCIRVTTISGKSRTFALGLQNSGDIQRVVDLINGAKQGGR